MYEGGDVHGAECGMDCSAADLDGDDGIEEPDGGLEGSEEGVLVTEYAKDAVLYAETDAGCRWVCLLFSRRLIGLKKCNVILRRRI